VELQQVNEDRKPFPTLAHVPDARSIVMKQLGMTTIEFSVEHDEAAELGCILRKQPMAALADADLLRACREPRSIVVQKAEAPLLWRKVAKTEDICRCVIVDVANRELAEQALFNGRYCWNAASPKDVQPNNADESGIVWRLLKILADVAPSGTSDCEKGVKAAGWACACADAESHKRGVGRRGTSPRPPRAPIWHPPPWQGGGGV